MDFWTLVFANLTIVFRAIQATCETISHEALNRNQSNNFGGWRWVLAFQNRHQQVKWRMSFKTRATTQLWQSFKYSEYPPYLMRSPPNLTRSHWIGEFFIVVPPLFIVNGSPEFDCHLKTIQSVRSDLLIGRKQVLFFSTRSNWVRCKSWAQTQPGHTCKL